MPTVLLTSFKLKAKNSSPMAVVLRLARHGRKKCPFYRLVVAHKEFRRDGRFLEVVGTYDPKSSDNKGNFKMDRIDHWISKGAKPSDTVAQLIKRERSTAVAS